MKTTINLLDPSQRHALNGVLTNKEDVAVIYGPPGTGKSHLILSLLFELAVRGDKVLFVSQNTEALNVIMRMFKKLDEELGIDDYSLSFLDFCWCLNDAAHKRVTHIRQQKNRIMTKPIGTLPYAEEEKNGEIPYALTYRELDINDNLEAEPDDIGFDELLMSSLRNVHHGDLIKDILHTVSNKSYRKALRLLNEYSDRNNMFAELNNPKNALKYLKTNKMEYSLHDVQVVVEDISETVGNVIGSRDMIAKVEMPVNDYLNYALQMIEYSKVVNINYFDELGTSIKDLAKTAKNRLLVDDKIEKVTEITVPSAMLTPILQQEEDDAILELNNLGDLEDYCKVLVAVKKKIALLSSAYKVDTGAKIKNIVNCAFSRVDFGAFIKDDYGGFEELGYDDLIRIIKVIEDYGSKNKIGKMVFKMPEGIKVVDKKNITGFVSNVKLMYFLSHVLEGTDLTIQDIIDVKKIKSNSIAVPIEMRGYAKNSDEHAKLCNTVLHLFKLKIDKIDNYTLEELNDIIERQTQDIDVALDILSKNKKVEFNSIKEAVLAINKNVVNRNVSIEHKQLDDELKPYLANSDDVEKSCETIIELSKTQIDLRELLDYITSVKLVGEISPEYINRVKNCLIEAEQKSFFSSEFFTIHVDENLPVWRQHIDTLVDYNRPDEFDAYVLQNRFIRNLKDALSQKNERVIDSYLNDESITFNEFREHLTRDIVGTIYNDAPASIRKRISAKYFSDYKSNHKKLQVREYLSGLQKLKLMYEDPAKVLSYYSNWIPASTNIEKIRKNSRMIAEAFPVTIATPADVSKYIAAKKASYDYVIFDEASQLLPGQALPSIYRAKKAVIVGDPHQMPPTKSITTLGFGMALDDGIDDDEQSVLDLAINLQLDATYHLKVHYRSESNKLFEPSLNAIYKKDGVLPIYEAKSNEMPLYIEDDLGDDDEKNFASVVRRVEYYLGKNKDASFCILFSRGDKQGLNGFRKYLEKTDNTTLAYLYEKDRLLVSTVTNCQGIQGDHVILYLPSYTSPRAMWFFKETAGAYRRLNVSITRAVKTMDIIMGDSRNKWIQVCQSFIDSDTCGPSQKKSAEMLNTLLTNAGQEIDESYLEKSLGPNARNIDSPLTQQLYDRLNEYYAERLGKDLKIWCEVGWNMIIPNAEAIEKNNRNVGFRIDIGIYSIKHKRFILGIEMDGATYHSGFNKVFSDLQRQAVLEKKGWNIYRIWSTNWLQDTEKEFQQLVKMIDEYLMDEFSDEDDDTDDEYGISKYDSDESFDDGLDDAVEIVDDEDITKSATIENGIRYRPSDIFQANKYEHELVNYMNSCMNNGKPIEMKYSNTQLDGSQKAGTPFQTIYIKEVDEKHGFFLGSFTLTSSPYRIKLNDVFEYKNFNYDSSRGSSEQEKKAEEGNDKKEEKEAVIPEGETVVSSELLSFYLGHNVGENIAFRYQTNRLRSGKKWRNYKLIRYTENYFWCRDLVTDKVFMFRRDRVIEIRI